MSNDDEVFLTKCRRNAGDIAGELANVVCLDVLWCLARPVTSLVWYRHAEAGFNDRIDLVSPPERALRESVQQNDERSLPSTTVFSSMPLVRSRLNLRSNNETGLIQ